MTSPLQFPHESRSNAVRRVIAEKEPRALRTFTPSQAVLARSAGVFHWTADGRRLYDYSSGVLVANLGHNPRRWMRRFAGYMGWDAAEYADGDGGCFEAVPLTAYNAITEIEARATERLLDSVQASPGGGRLDTVMWAASGSEAIQKALWACLHHDESRDVILATRYGFHGKKGLAGAVTGSEKDRDRDPRVKFISFPMKEVDDLAAPADACDLSRYAAELQALGTEYGRRINCLMTEPYLGGGGSYHPPAAYLQLLQRFCRDHGALFILDEVQSNFGRTGAMYAFEKYGLEPDFVCLGKGLGNGVPVSAAVGRGDVMASLKYGEASDTWSANPLACAAVLATLDEFEETNVLEHARLISEIFTDGLLRLKETGVIAKVRGEGMVFGIECGAAGGRSADDVASAVVEACYLGEPDGDGIHLLGPLAGNVIRVSPPMTISEEESRTSLELLYNLVERLGSRLGASQRVAVSQT
ncbi:MAG TPA: aspartate aminotransferase family protein [Planctomycetaceae bacterium]|nr:aspartate aminotransferase family protein [Planctomycetaceae bacterium]